MCSELYEKEDEDEWQGKVRAIELKIGRLEKTIINNDLELRSQNNKDVQNFKESSKNMKKQIEDMKTYIEEFNKKTQSSLDEILSIIRK